MVIEKVHGLQATGLSMNERFTLLQSAAPDLTTMRPKGRPSVGSYFNQNINFRNRNWIDQIARRLEWQAKRQALRQRQGTLRRFGSESSLPGLRRSNSFSNLSQSSVKNRVAWRQSNGNLSRAASVSNLSNGGWRNFRRRGVQRALRGRFSGMWAGRGTARGRGRGTWGAGRARRPQLVMTRGQARGAGRGRGRGAGRGRGRGSGSGRGRGGMPNTNVVKPVPTKEELDDQLDQYMAGSKAALDKDLDQYMKNAMELE